MAWLPGVSIGSGLSSELATIYTQTGHVVTSFNKSGDESMVDRFRNEA